MKEFWTKNETTHPVFSILHVDSDMLMRTILKKTVPNNIFRLDSAANGREAFLLMEKNHYAYDVVITEMHMHYANGYEIFNRIQKHGPKTTVIVTSNMSFFHIREGLDLARENYFKKPLIIGKLIKRLTELLVPCSANNLEPDDKLLQEESALTHTIYNSSDFYPGSSNNLTVEQNQFDVEATGEVAASALWTNKEEFVGETSNINRNEVLETSFPQKQLIVPVSPGKRWW